MGKAETSRENGKLGGRPKGSKSKATLEREAVLKEFRQKVARSADVLFRSQLHKAVGQTFFYKIPKVPVKNSKGKITHYTNGKPKLVEDQWEIESCLQNLIETGDLYDKEDPNATYYFITTKEPDNKSIDSLLDRTFGKAEQSMDITTGGEKLPVLVEFLNNDKNTKNHTDTE